MKIVWWVIGIALSLSGLAWIIALMVEVFSQKERFTSFSTQIWGYMAFHLITMGLGLFFFDRATRAKREARTTEA